MTEHKFTVEIEAEWEEDVRPMVFDSLVEKYDGLEELLEAQERAIHDYIKDEAKHAESFSCEVNAEHVAVDE